MVKAQCIPVRYTQLFLLFLAVGSATVLRNCMFVGILAMIEKSSNADVQIYDWTKKTQGIILSSTMWGETLIQAVGGVASNKFGAKVVLFISTFISGILLMLLPLFATVGDWIGVCVCRAIQGIFLSTIFPCIHSLLGKWSPLGERLRSGTLVYSGSFIVNIFSMPTAAFIAGSTLGWPYIFYFFGLLSILFSLLWFWYGSESPSEHVSITKEEKYMIEGSLKYLETKKPSIPWKSIFTSKAYLALIFTQIGCDWGYTVVQTEMATFFRLGLNIDLEKTGYFTSLANIVSAVVMVGVSVLADLIHNKSYLSNTTSRKVFNTIGAWGATLSLLMISILSNTHHYYFIGCIILASATDAFTGSGFFLNHIDLSPNYASVLYGMSSNIAKVINMMSPIITGVIVKDPSDLSQWQIVFLITACMYFFANLIFIGFGSGEMQKWDAEKEKDEIELQEVKDMSDT